MALGTNLHDDLLALFQGAGLDIPSIAQEWADLMEDYATAVVPPSTSVSTAAATLQSALVSAFSAGLGLAPPLVDAAFIAFAAAVGAGMAPTFVAVPPSTPLFVPWMLTPQPATHEMAAAIWEARIDAWMRTGTATPSAGGPPVFWT